MKKIIYITIILFLFPRSAFAYIGDIAGNIYNTDIKAYIDGMEIQSYCLEGKTAIPIESLREYGFNVVYNNDSRALFVERKGIPQKAPDFKGHTSSFSVGSVISNYYESDITTYIDGYKVPSYALDGFSIIAIEDLTKYDYYYTPLNSDSWSMDYSMHRPFNKLGFYHIWDNDSRTINLISLRDGFIWETNMGKFYATGGFVYHIKKAGSGIYALKASIGTTEYNWYLMNTATATYGLNINPVDADHLHINSTTRFSTPDFKQYDEGYFMEYEIIAPIMSKEVIIDGTPYYAENMFLPVQNYLYVREDLFDKINNN